MPFILHCADLHLNQYSHHLSDPAFTVFRRIIDDCNQCGVDLLLIAGDLYDSVFVSEELIRAVQQTLSRCTAEVYICGGNHDYCAAFSPLMASGYSDNVHILPPGEMREYPLPQYGIVLHGCSMDAPHQTTSPLKGFTVKPDGFLHIGLLHADLAAGSSYAPITAEEIAASGLDYLALGHCHSYRKVKYGKTEVRYPGTPQPRRMDEDGGILPFFVMDGEISPLEEGELRRISVLQQYALSLDLSGCDGAETTAERIREKLSALPDPLQSRVVLTLQGETANGYRPVLSELQRSFRDMVLEFKLIDHSYPGPEDTDQPNTLQGIFLSKLKERMREDDEDAETLLLARKYGMQAFYGEVRPDAD